MECVSLSGNLVPRLIWICGIQWWCSLFQFLTGDTSFGKFGPKNQNYQFELKFHTRLIWICRITSNIFGVLFFCFRPEKLFLGKSGQKNQNCKFKLKFGIKTNLNMWNLMIMFTISVFDWKYLFRQIWSEKSKFSVWAEISH